MGVKMTDGGESSESGGRAGGAAAGGSALTSCWNLEGRVINSLSKDIRNISFQPSWIALGAV